MKLPKGYRFETFSEMLVRRYHKELGKKSIPKNRANIGTAMVLSWIPILNVFVMLAILVYCYDDRRLIKSKEDK